MILSRLWDSLCRVFGDRIERQSGAALLRDKYPPVHGLSAETAEATGARLTEGEITFPDDESGGESRCRGR